MSGNASAPDVLVLGQELFYRLRVLRHLPAKICLALGRPASDQQGLPASRSKERAADVGLCQEPGQLLASDFGDVDQVIADLDAEKHGRAGCLM